MKPWTPEARQVFDAFCEARRAALLQSGADPDEVFADWREAVARAAAADPEASLGPDALRAALAALDPGPAADKAAAPAAPPPVPPAAPLPSFAPAPGPARRLPMSGLIPLALFGVFLPVLTLVVELASSMCASTFFDPLPSWANIVLVALVPLANALALAALRSPARPAWRPAGWLNGFAIGIAAFYALMFAIVTPFALIGIAFYGLGFLPLSPLLSLACALVLRRLLRRTAAAEARPAPRAVGWAIAAALLALGLAALPRLTTLTGLQWAASDQPALRARGLRLLRTAGSEPELLRAAYLTRPFEADPWSWALHLFSERVPQAKVQEIYYRVTGRPFNAVKPPPLRGRRGMVFDETSWDFAQGGDAVAARVRGLTLSQSRLDGRIEAAAGTAYLEWTLVFKNADQREHEARAEVLLPPGAAVSRLTLWIDGEEREAAFGGRAQVRQAYQQVVQRRRDPVLVTTAGRDRVLVQCFPVPAQGGTMKVRLGITAPLVVRAPDEGLLPVPRLLEYNFGLPDALQPSFWFDAADGAFSDTAGLVQAGGDGSGASAHGETGAAALEDGFCLRVRRPASAAAAWARDDRDPAAPLIVQRLVRAPGAPPKRLAVVIDGSARLAPHAAAIGKILDGILRSGTESRAWFASDDVAESAVDRASVGRLSDPKRYAGGCDNVAALIRAWDWAAENGGAVLWLHGTQPMESDAIEALTQRWERQRGGAPVYALQFGRGPDRLANRIGEHPLFRPIGPVLDPAGDAAAWMAGWSGEAGPLAWERTKVEAGEAAPADAVAGSSQLVRLWALDEVRRRASARSQDATARAIELAKTWQLVTPLTGAVVLETQAQYKAAGLKDIDPATAPDIIPEPLTLLLLGPGIALLFILRGVLTLWGGRLRARLRP